ncbi:2-nitropropane dioxygenase [Akanthomyces lecanii RCEF 1005]|uniref:2-nitropropane dioxygenase n=1 Tax=Akanthomyces lecanii RCEF 1005 TaxID=1081108 RepID=A0A168KVY4_CORDF|nr:2-nitropropane dioxygenase [Akanthomyces lecanii RCEF 1005]
MQGPITTPLTGVLNCQHPIMLAGMAQVSGGRLAAAVANAGGFSVVGGYECTPEQLRDAIADMKQRFTRPNLPFGVAVAIPKCGGGARKTNRDVGRLDELIDMAIHSGAKLFVSTAGVPPRYIIDRLHDAGVLVMNLVGHPKHAVKALDAGVDMVCAQGKEGRGHTGNIPTSILVPAVVSVARRYTPPLLGGSAALVVAGGGIASGPGLAAALMQGAAGVWVCTRFVASVEADVPDAAKQAIVDCDFEGTERTLVLTGRPLRMRANEYIKAWHSRPDEIQRLCGEGVVPMDHDKRAGRPVEIPVLMGEVAGSITVILPARQIVQDMVREATEMLNLGRVYLGERSKL